MTKWDDLCRDVMKYASDAPVGSLVKYAAAYARDGIGMVDTEMVSTQAIYILSNIKHCQGPVPKALKARLREFL